MFDVYMEAHALDPSVRRRMTLALGAAVITSAAAIAMYTGAQRLGVARVIAPKVEVEFLLATAAPPPVAAPPPDAPAAAVVAEVAQRDDTPAPRREPEADAAPIEDPSARPRPASTASAATTGTGNGVPGPAGVPGLRGAPPCIPGACTIGAPRALPPAVPRADDDPAKLPMSVAQGRATVSPDPSREALAATRAGASGRGGTTVVAYCVGTDGKVDSTQTKRSAGDADVDRICRDTIRRWRFTPYVVGGRAKRMCSEYTFVIEFD